MRWSQEDHLFNKKTFKKVWEYYKMCPALHRDIMLVLVVSSTYFIYQNLYKLDVSHLGCVSKMLTHFFYKGWFRKHYKVNFISTIQTCFHLSRCHERASCQRYQSVLERKHCQNLKTFFPYTEVIFYYPGHHSIVYINFILTNGQQHLKLF